jgi:hypothetical protein
VGQVEGGLLKFDEMRTNDHGFEVVASGEGVSADVRD